MRSLFKRLARGVALITVLPSLASFAVRRRWLGADRALEGSTQSLARLPGLSGIYRRRAFLERALAQCAPSATVHYGTIFSQAGARIEENVYIGPSCHLGLVWLERDVLLAAGVHVPSGGQTHAADDINRPIRVQGGKRTMVRIGEGSWIGSAAVVMADVGRHCIVGAGAVVTKPLPDYAVAVGVPARVIRSRRQEPRPEALPVA